MVMGIFIIWLILAFFVGIIGNNRSIGFWGAFLLSVAMSPLLGLIFTLISKENYIPPPQPPNQLYRPPPKKRAAQSSPQKTVELSKLESMLTDGAISQEEYERIKADIIKK